MNKINFYIFYELLKGFSLIFFIFISIAWLLQFTRLMSVSNLLQIDTLSILILSTYLIPNIFTIILPFIVIIGLSITFIKLFKDREIITIYTLGLSTNVIKKPILLFSISIIIISIIFNFYLSPNIYEKFKLNEFELRNSVNFEKIVFSNFIELNEHTIIDFKKNAGQYDDIFINFADNSENIIYAKNGSIKKVGAIFLFTLIDGFKLTLLENGDIEQLQFEKYEIEFKDQDFKEYNNFDKNTSNLLEDLKSKDYLNLSYKFYDSLIFILIFFFFYIYNIKKYYFDIKSLLIFISISTTFLILNQIIKNINSSLVFYLIFTGGYLLIFFTIIYYTDFKRSE